MGLSRNRRSEQRADYWPGFVDAMATLLLVLIFLLTVFMVAQFFLSQEISGKDTALNKLNSQIAELTELLALERAKGKTWKARWSLCKQAFQARKRHEIASLCSLKHKRAIRIVPVVRSRH